tara:strand:+ start:548 stop:826 length:279 start_codon:yes stop_codon:yes gene_type:complete
MNTYLVTIAIASDNRPERIQDSVERMTRDWFGSTATVDNIVLEDPEQDPDFDNDGRTCTEQAEDDHNEGVARARGLKTYTRTDGITIDLEED